MIHGITQRAAEFDQCALYLSRGQCAPETCADSGGPIRRCTWRRFEELAELDTGAWWGCSWRCKHQQALQGTGARLQTGHAAFRLGDLNEEKWKQRIQSESNRIAEERGISSARNNGRDRRVLAVQCLHSFSRYSNIKKRYRTGRAAPSVSAFHFLSSREHVDNATGCFAETLFCKTRLMRK